MDYAVRMVRLPDDARADTRLAEGRLGGAEIERLAVHLARFDVPLPCAAGGRDAD